MTLTPADRQRLREAFQARIGNTALPSGATIDDLCRNLVLAIPALLETCEEQRARIAHLEYENSNLTAQRDAGQRALDHLTAQLEADPCP